MDLVIHYGLNILIILIKQVTGKIVYINKNKSNANKTCDVSGSIKILDFNGLVLRLYPVYIRDKTYFKLIQ